METNESSSSLRSNDSGIELLSSAKLSKDYSETELIDVTQSETDDDELIMPESDIDTDSDFERVDSDTELLIKEAKNLDSRHSNSSVLSRFCIPECLVRQCGPHQCYSSVRNSLMDSYGSVVLCVRCLKGCGSCHHRNLTPGEPRNQAIEKLTRLSHSVLNLVRLILDRRVFLTTLLYGLFAFIGIICIEVIFILRPAQSMLSSLYSERT